MTAEQVKQVEAVHAKIQEHCNASLLSGCEAIKLASELAKALEQFKASLADCSTFEHELEASFNEDVAPWLVEYMKVAALNFANPFHHTKASIMQKAFKILDIIPQISTKHEPT